MACALWLPASEAVVVAYTMPVWASLLAWHAGRTDVAQRLLALVMAFAGIAALMGGRIEASTRAAGHCQSCRPFASRSHHHTKAVPWRALMTSPRCRSDGCVPWPWPPVFEIRALRRCRRRLA